MNKHLSGLGVIGHVSHASTCMNAAMLRAVIASQKAELVACGDDLIFSKLDEKVKMPDIKPSVPQGAYLGRKKHKPNSGLSIGSYKYSKNKKK